MILGFIIESVTGMVLDKYVEKIIFMNHLVLNIRSLILWLKGSNNSRSRRHNWTVIRMTVWSVSLTFVQLRFGGKFMMKRPGIRWEGCLVTQGCFLTPVIWLYWCRLCSMGAVMGRLSCSISRLSRGLLKVQQRMLHSAWAGVWTATLQWLLHSGY